MKKLKETWLTYMTFCRIFGHDLWISEGFDVTPGEHPVFHRYEYCRNPGCNFKREIEA